MLSAVRESIVTASPPVPLPPRSGGEGLVGGFGGRSAFPPTPNPSPPLALLAGGGESRRCMRESSVQHPGILCAAALAGVDDQRTCLERNAREPAGHNSDPIAAGEHERPQIDMARREAFLHECRYGGERERRLGDEAARIALQFLAEGFDRHLVGLRADQHAVAARAV